VSYNSVAIFSRLAVVASEICEIPRNSPKIRTYTVQGQPRLSMVSIESAYICNFLLVIIVTVDVSPTVFEILTH